MDWYRKVFMIVVAAAVLLAFGAGIVLAGLYSTTSRDPTAFPEVVTYFVSAANGTLAANLGAVLGISAMLGGWRDKLTAMEKFQFIAAIWYLSMIVVAAAYWGRAGFSEDPTQVVSVLPEITKNGLGIFIAVLAAVLGVQTAITRTRREGATV